MTTNDSCLNTHYTVVGNIVQQAVVFYTIFHCDGSDTRTYYHQDTARTSSIIPVPAGECSIEYRALSSLYMGEDIIIIHQLMLNSAIVQVRNIYTYSLECWKASLL